MYNEDFWGSAGVDNGAYPFGDKKVNCVVESSAMRCDARKMTRAGVKKPA